MEFAILPGSALLQVFFYALAAAIVIAAGVLVKYASLGCGDSEARASSLQRRYWIGASMWLFVVSAASYSGALLPRGGPPLPFVAMVTSILLFNILAVAILSTPMFAYFGRDHLNVWVMWMPYTLLPAVMVLAAWAGHLIIFRALSLRAASRPDPR